MVLILIMAPKKLCQPNCSKMILQYTGKNESEKWHKNKKHKKNIIYHFPVPDWYRAYANITGVRVGYVRYRYFHFPSFSKILIARVRVFPINCKGICRGKYSFIIDYWGMLP